jgi:hypothetical protein
MNPRLPVFAKFWDYLPGRDLKEELPITAFKPEEFAVVVD